MKTKIQAVLMAPRKEEEEEVKKEKTKSWEELMESLPDKGHGHSFLGSKTK